MVVVGGAFVAFFFALKESVTTAGHIAIIGAAVVVVGVGIVTLLKCCPDQAVAAAGRLAIRETAAVV